MPQTPIYRDQGGALMHVGSGGELDIESGGVLDMQNGSQVKHKGAAVPGGMTFTPAAGTTNQSLVTIQVKDTAGNNLAAVVPLLIWLSDASTGAGLTATTASGTVVAGASGADMGDLTSKKAKMVQTDATGKYVLAITDSAKTGFYVAAQNPFSGLPVVSSQLITANYG